MFFKTSTTKTDIKAIKDEEEFIKVASKMQLQKKEQPAKPIVTKEK